MPITDYQSKYLAFGDLKSFREHFSNRSQFHVFETLRATRLYLFSPERTVAA